MEHFLFFPVIVLMALVLVVLSFKLLFRLLLLFIFVLFCWFILSLTGLVSSPIEVIRCYQSGLEAKKTSGNQFKNCEIIIENTDVWINIQRLVHD